MLNNIPCKKYKISIILVSGLLLVLFLIFQSSHIKPDAQTAKNQATLINTYWKLIELGGQAIVTAEGEREMKITLREDNKVTGFAGCNSFFGSYRIDNGNIQFNELAASRMFCGQTMDKENLFLKSLAGASRYKIVGQTLQLSDSKGSLMAQLKAVYLK